MTKPLNADPWTRFRIATRARIGLGRSGDGIPTLPTLELQLAHARARDAVHGAADFGRIAAELAPMPSLLVRSRADTRATYLVRPDLGRRLDVASAEALQSGSYDIAFVVADGLSASAVQAHAAPLIHAAVARLASFRIAPVVLASQARVAIGDEIGERLGASLVILLVGERPGLSVSDSLGVYMTWAPKVGRRDSERNCISNIHADGLSIAAAADKIAWLSREATRLRLTGIDLKEDAGSAVLDHGPVAMVAE